MTEMVIIHISKLIKLLKQKTTILGRVRPVVPNLFFFKSPFFNFRPSSKDEHLQVLSHGPQPVKGGLSPLGWIRSTVLSGGVRICWGLVHKG